MPEMKFEATGRRKTSVAKVRLVAATTGRLRSLLRADPYALGASQNFLRDLTTTGIFDGKKGVVLIAKQPCELGLAVYAFKDAPARFIHML